MTLQATSCSFGGISSLLCPPKTFHHRFVVRAKGNNFCLFWWRPKFCIIIFSLNLSCVLGFFVLGFECYVIMWVEVSFFFFFIDWIWFCFWWIGAVFLVFYLIQFMGFRCYVIMWVKVCLFFWWISFGSFGFLFQWNHQRNLWK